MKIRMSTVYLVTLVLGIIAAGVLTGIYGNDIGIWISYSFLGVYGIMIMVNAIMTEKISSINVESIEEKQELTKEEVDGLPDKLGGEEPKVEEKVEEPQEVIPPVEEPKEEERKLTDEEIKVATKIANYIKTNLDKGHKLEVIRVPLDKAYGSATVDFVLQSLFKVEEPELPDLGEPEKVEEVTPETLSDDMKENKEQHEATKDLKKPLDKKEIFKCEKCGKVCKNKGAVKNHMRLSKKCQSL